MINSPDYPDLVLLSSLSSDQQKTVPLAASEGIPALYAAIPSMPDKIEMLETPSGPFSNPMVYRISKKLSSSDQVALRKFMQKLNKASSDEQRRKLLSNEPAISSGGVITEERVSEGEKILRIDPYDCKAFAYYSRIFIQRFIPPAEFLVRHGLDERGFGDDCIAEAILLLHDQGILKRPFPVSVSDVFVIKSELEDWLEIGNKKNKFRTKKISKTKHLKSNEVRNIFSRAFKKLRENNNGEAPTYKEVWDAVFNENDLYENNLGGGLPLRREYDENEIIENMESSDRPNPSLWWHIKKNESSGTYHLKSLPAFLSRLKKHPL
jgi:hypothetical protein